MDADGQVQKVAGKALEPDAMYRVGTSRLRWQKRSELQRTCALLPFGHRRFGIQLIKGIAAYWAETPSAKPHPESGIPVHLGQRKGFLLLGLHWRPEDQIQALTAAALLGRESLGEDLGFFSAKRIGDLREECVGRWDESLMALHSEAFLDKDHNGRIDPEEIKA